MFNHEDVIGELESNTFDIAMRSYRRALELALATAKTSRSRREIIYALEEALRAPMPTFEEARARKEEKKP